MTQTKNIEAEPQRRHEGPPDCDLCACKGGAACRNARAASSSPASNDGEGGSLQWPRGWYAWSSLLKEEGRRLRA